MSITEQHRIELLTDECREVAVKQMVRALLGAGLLGGLFRSCLNCGHWVDNPNAREPTADDLRRFGSLEAYNDYWREKCGLTNPLVRPPAKVIVTGCNQHTDNIPF